MRYTLALIAAFCILPHHAESQTSVLPSVTVSATESAVPVHVVRGELIGTFPPGKVNARVGEVLVIQIRDNAPFTIHPEIKPLKIRDVDGTLTLLIAVPKDAPTITVNASQDAYRIPKKAFDAAPPFTSRDELNEFVKPFLVSLVETHTVKVGDSPPDPPGPGPNPPEPPSNETAKAIFDAAMKLAEPRREVAQTMAKIYRSVSTQAAATDMSYADMATMVKQKTVEALDSATRQKWVPVGIAIDDEADKATDKDSGVRVYEHIAEGLEAVR